MSAHTPHAGFDVLSCRCSDRGRWSLSRPKSSQVRSYGGGGGSKSSSLILKSSSIVQSQAKCPSAVPVCGLNRSLCLKSKRICIADRVCSRGSRVHQRQRGLTSQAKQREKRIAIYVCSSALRLEVLHLQGSSSPRSKSRVGTHTILSDCSLLAVIPHETAYRISPSRMKDEIRRRDYEGMLRRRLNGADEPKDMPLALLQMITNEFSEENKIGQGGFGVVYKGELGDVIVAVKRIYVNLDKLDNDDKLFDREFNSLRKTNHPNVVRFLGFCSNTSKIPIEMTGSGETILANWRERLLCFEFISSGSLDKHITDELRGLKWETRYDIITGICKGLCYLHEQKKIIHMDLKPANILLDDLMVPKITDFGLSRPNKNSHTKAQPIGTRGYIAPEYMEGSKTTPACDIYSLGVIIIELVTGCMEVPDENNVLRRWRHRWRKPPTLLQYQQVTRCIDIARRCREQKPEDRPSIKKIIDSLSESTDGHASQISPRFDEDDMLRINPLELRLPSELKNKISRSIELSNGTRNCIIAFSIQLPSKQYSAQPDKGIVRPESKYRVNITVQAQDVEGQDHADKFIVQSMQVEASEGLRDDDITERMFEKTGKIVDKVDLMVVYEPTKPPENCKHRQDTNTPTEEVPEDIGSSSYNNTIYSSKRPQGFNFQPPESISRNLTTSLTSDQTMDLATGAIGSLLPKLSQLLNEFNLEKNIRSDVDYVIQELRVMRIDLCNVSEVQRDNSNEHIKLVKLWADEVRELSYDIEDVVDGFLMHIAGSEPATSTEGLMGFIHKLMSCMMGLIQKMIDGSHTEDDDLYQIGGAIRNFKNQVQNKSGSKEKYKVEKVVAKTVSTINAHHLSALAKGSNKLVGINDAMKDFTKRLTGVDVKVHSIFGSGGLGKTTLARAVYNQLKGSFGLTAFVPVGRNPDVKKLLYDILFELDERRYINLKAANLDERQLINVLTKLLENNRYLIVIDDMWEKKVWHDLIKFAFLDGKRGSKIVITTRIFEVATIATDVYKLHPLTHDYSEELFYATLSPEEGRCENKVTDEVIKKILQKCGGVPLAIITIASLLASKQKEDWPKVYNSIGFGPDVNEDADNTRKILLFSYSDLPRHLRTCLLHLSIFPEDKLIDKKMVIWMWVAEGFVHAEPCRGLFELGERYFNQLISRSMIQLVMSTKLFCIHDLVLDMICSLSKDENFVTVLETDEQHTSSKNNARRLAVQKRGIEKPDPPTTNCMVQLRSLYATYCDISVIPPLSSFKVLRVLSLERCTFSEDRPYHLEHIGKLLQLRYLGLGRMDIEELPDEIAGLCFLQTLILNETKIKELPHCVGLLRQLKCLCVTTHCYGLRVPDWMVNMTSLEYLSLVNVKIPLFFVEGLSKLKELRDLIIDGEILSGDNWCRTLVKSIGDLLNLQSLEILHLWVAGDDIWEAFVPPRHLHHMILQVAFSSVPCWMDSTHLPSLSYLELRLRNMEAHCLEILGSFPELHTLILRTQDGSWLAVTGSGAFPKLRQLYSRTMLRFDRGVMPRLEYLELVVAVPELEKTNFDCDFTSLGNLPSLQKVRCELVPSLQNVGSRLVPFYGDPNYIKRIVAAVKHALDTHPHRRPILQWIYS